MLRVLMLLLLLAAPLHAEVVAREGEGWLERRDDGGLVLHLKGTPYEMGLQHGRLLREQARKNLQRIIDNQEELGRSDEYQAYLMMRDLMHDMLRRHIPARFVEELRGLAEGAGIPFEQVE